MHVAHGLLGSITLFLMIFFVLTVFNEPIESNPHNLMGMATLVGGCIVSILGSIALAFMCCNK